METRIIYQIDKGDIAMYDENNKIVELESRINELENAICDLKESLKTGITKGLGKIVKTAPTTAESNLTDGELAKIDDIMRDFNFEKVHKVMEMLDWKWAMTKYGVPTVEELRGEARRLLVEAANEETQVATGGFRAVYEKNGASDPDPFISLEFVLEECEGFEDGDEEEDNDEPSSSAPWAGGAE